MSAIELPDDPAGYFQDGWPVYRKIVDNNYMFHREIYGDITSFIGRRFQQRPISVLEMGCGDASQTAAALRNCRVSENDFPETLSEYAAMAEASGFSGVDPLNRYTWHRTLALVNR